MAYRVVISRSAERDLRRLERLPVFRAAQRVIMGLSEVPRPEGARKLTQRPGWRIRTGDYRVIYDINDAERIVTVQVVRHRSVAYDE